MSAQKPKSHVPKSTASAATNTASRSNTAQRISQLVQNYLLIWVDGNIDPKNEDCENTLIQLRGVVRKVDHCTTAAECIEFLNKMDDEKAFIISSGACRAKSSARYPRIWHKFVPFTFSVATKHGMKPGQKNGRKFKVYLPKDTIHKGHSQT